MVIVNHVLLIEVLINVRSGNDYKEKNDLKMIKHYFKQFYSSQLNLSLINNQPLKVILIFFLIILH